MYCVYFIKLITTYGRQETSAGATAVFVPLAYQTCKLIRQYVSPLSYSKLVNQVLFSLQMIIDSIKTAISSTVLCKAPLFSLYSSILSF